ncbi:hypothetical protein [Psychroserpens sp. Hel_I_66]|uniref:hypothetical protein n=1 Tax=Psychroserpens sp. Hel_I_66 TaxID=1250004 RepID=UPI000646BDD3|nr:hypothetical protein [Psychroserpens sp. Hel_I_66]
MTTITNNKPPVWFWIISIIALLWNLMGVAAYLSMHYMTDEMIADLEPHQQIAANYDYPAWYIAIFAIAVFSGTIACIGLLLRKKWAYILFIISFFTATFQQIYYILKVDGIDKFMPIMIIIVCAILVWFSKRAISKHWIK